jgi:hypothetical protein
MLPLSGPRRGIGLTAFSLFAAVGLAGSALAQGSALAPSAMSKAPPLERDNDIIVTGKTEAPPAEVRNQARQITDVSGKFRSPLAMFQDKVCPGIMGMPADMAEIMVDRIRYNAERVGLATAKIGDCTPNILVIFVLNGQAVVKDLQKERPYFFNGLEFHEVKELANNPGPVHNWNNIVLRSRQGDELQGSRDADPTKIPVLNVAQSQSHIFMAHRLDIANAIILIDIPAIDGMSVVQLADYATMRAFTKTRPAKGELAASTILNLFDPDEAAAHAYELTDFDIAYLRSVYEGVDSLNAASKIAAINDKLRDVERQRIAEIDK